MQLMAARAGHVARGVSARGPIVRGVRLMAAEAIRVLLLQRVRMRFGAEIDDARQRAAARLHVCAARSVAGLALQAAVTEGAARIVRTRMLGAEDAGDAGLLWHPRQVSAPCGLYAEAAGVAGGGRAVVAGGRRGGVAASSAANAGTIPVTAAANATIAKLRRTCLTQLPAVVAGMLMHDLQVGDSARTVAHGAALHARRAAENRAPLRVLQQRGRAAVLRDVRRGAGPVVGGMAGRADRHVGGGGNRIARSGRSSAARFDSPVEKVVACTAVSSTG